MVVAVILVRPVQPPADQVVDVIAVGHCLMSAPSAVVMRLIAGPGAGVAGWMLLVHGDYVLIDVVAVRVMQMAVMEVVDVTVVADCGVAAIGSVLV